MDVFRKFSVPNSAGADEISRRQAYLTKQEKAERAKFLSRVDWRTLFGSWTRAMDFRGRKKYHTNGQREVERRRSQIECGQLRRENGLAE